MIGFNVVVIAIALTSAAGLAYFSDRYSGVGRFELNQGVLDPEDETVGEAENFLLVGTDRAAGLDPGDPVLIGRDSSSRLADAIMILRVDPSTNEAALLSIPRDLYVPIAGTGRSAKINSALRAGSGSPDVLIETIKATFNVPVHHYIEVDFLGFKKLVDTVGGVSIYFDTPVRDTRTGLEILEVGCVDLDGEDALAYARSRQLEFQDENGRWRNDNAVDFGRVNRQQDFIKRAMQAAVNEGVGNPVKANQLISAAADAVDLDNNLQARDLVGLAQAFRSFDPASLPSYTLPVSDANIGGAAVLRLQVEEAEPVINIFRGFRTGELKPGAIELVVLNGTGDEGVAALAGAGFGRSGFIVLDTGNAADDSFAETVVRYEAGDDAAAAFVNRFLRVPGTLEEMDETSDGAIEIVVGKDWQGVLDEAEALGEEPTGTTSLAPATTTTVPGTSTTQRGVVPETPEGVVCT